MTRRKLSNKDRRLKAAVDMMKPFALTKISSGKIRKSKKKGMKVINCLKNKNGEYINQHGSIKIVESTLIKNSNDQVLAFIYVGGTEGLIDGVAMNNLKSGSNNLVSKSHGHHTQHGESYGYGISKKYRVDGNGNSYGEYSCRTGVSKEKQLILATPTIESIHHAVDILEKYLGKSFMKKAFNDLVQGVNKNTPFNVTKYFVNYILNIDIETEYHTDTDAAYSVLSSSKCSGEATFYFKNICEVPFCNDKLVIIFYAAKEIEHCQKILKRGFINSGSYVQQKLLNHIYKSAVERSEDDTRSVKRIKYKH